MALHPVVLAGGSGTRLWPLSREYFPKQFLALMGERSLLQQTVARLDGIDGLADPVVVCNEEHRFLVAEHMRQMGKSTSAILLEPEGRNTAPALTLAALSLKEAVDGSGDDPVMLVAPSDHVIREVAVFQAAVQKGAELAETGCMVTFGIVPTAPETGYGYIRKGPPVSGAPNPDGDGRGVATSAAVAFRVAEFVEKPDQDSLEKMLTTGQYLWNSGIFMMRVSTWLDQLARYRPDIAAACKAAYEKGQLDGDFYRPDVEEFMACPSESIDYAVMERLSAATGSNGPTATECVVLPLDVGWSDLGTWSTLWETGAHDADGNVIEGDVYAQSMTNSLLIGQHRLVAAVGLEDVIVVETADAVLVADKDRVQDVKELVNRLKAEDREEQENHRKVHRPWGTYESVDSGPRFKVKRLTVDPGAALSLQMHHHRAEHWVVVKGTAKVTRGDEEFLLTENQSAYVPVGVMHRLENPGTIPLEIVEVQSGSYLEEDDIIRVADRYNRHDH